MQKVIKSNTSLYFINLHDKYKKILRFVTVGCINTGVDFLTFTVLHAAMGCEKLISQTAGYGMGIVNSFILNKLWTFENRNSSDMPRQLFRFLTVNAVSLAVSLLGLKLLNDTYGINVYVSKILVTAGAQVVNYTGYKLLVFRGKLS